MATEKTGKKLYDLLSVRNFEDLKALDTKTGRPPVDQNGQPDVNQADMFTFSYRAESGKDYGSAVIMLNPEEGLKIFFGDNLGRSMESEDKQEWYQFLEQLKDFSTRNFMGFSAENIARLRYSLQGQAALKESLFESWYGNSTTSWNDRPAQARLMIKHNRRLGENDARFRYIEGMFIETSDGERFRLPFKRLAGGRAMLEHVRQGGRPYDLRGQHITSMVEELNVLSRFRRANHGRIFEGNTEHLVNETSNYYENLNKVLKGLGRSRGYQMYFEDWKPLEITEQDTMVDDIKRMFVEENIDSRIEDALPLLAKIQKGINMKEVKIFEDWVNNLVEGTWSVPDTPEKQDELVDLLSKDFPVGADAMSSTGALYDLFGDDELFDQLGELAKEDANADARDLVIARLEELRSLNNGIDTVLDQLASQDQNDQNTEEPKSDIEEPESDEEDQEPMAESENDYTEYSDSLEKILKHAGVGTTEPKTPEYEIGVMENVLLDDHGETFDHILNRFKFEVRQFKETGDLDNDLFEALYDYYFNRGEMPYGVAKARTGDPMNWVTDRLHQDLGSDYQDEEFDEGMGGALAGGLAGAAIGKTPSAAITGAEIGSNLQDMVTNEATCNLTEAGAMCPVHGLEECGVYETATLTLARAAESKDDLERIKTLAGTSRS